MEKSAELNEVQREWRLMRQRNSRLCGRHGFKGKREEKDG